jgi:hypothetical protein
MKNAVSWNVTPCGSCENPYFEGMYYLHHQGEKKQKNSFHSDYRGDTFLQNVGSYKNHAGSHPRRWHSSKIYSIQ